MAPLNVRHPCLAPCAKVQRRDRRARARFSQHMSTPATIRPALVKGAKGVRGGVFAPVSGGRAGAAPYDHWGGGAHGGAHSSCTCIDMATSCPTVARGRSRRLLQGK
eukprot:3808789-Prymnesium_polylepis.2